ncbi:MAG TPA: response regulator transcription factor [Terriglobales bacterium]|jgi:DNA-binding NarL/FixJ family response regulator|nr:response regulator transcription factor [Terriglobales bacterium]
MTLEIIKVVIADDHTLFREGLKRVLALEKDILVVGEASNSAEAVEVVARRLPDVLLLDLKMPAGDAVESLGRVAEVSPATKVMILTAFAEKRSVVNSAKGRARGYVLKGISAPTLIEAIRKVHRGEIWVDPDLPEHFEFERIATNVKFDMGPPAHDILRNLTKREMEILQLVAAGFSNEEIGKKVFISRKTVKTHLTNIFDKLGVNNRLNAALWIMPIWKKRSPTC